MSTQHSKRKMYQSMDYCCAVTSLRNKFHHFSVTWQAAECHKTFCSLPPYSVVWERELGKKKKSSLRQFEIKTIYQDRNSGEKKTAMITVIIYIKRVMHNAIAHHFLIIPQVVIAPIMPTPPSFIDFYIMYIMSYVMEYVFGQFRSAVMVLLLQLLVHPQPPCCQGNTRS